MGIKQEIYKKEMTVQKKFTLNKNTDKDILKHLEKVENFQGYIKSLIRKDISNG